MATSKANKPFHFIRVTKNMFEEEYFLDKSYPSIYQYSPILLAIVERTTCP
jgi:hypothetical protein